MANEKIVYMKLGDIEPYSNNPRLNAGSVDYVAKSIKEFGFKQPIVVDSNHVIIAGHTRYEAAKQLKLKEVPVIVASDLTDEQVKAYRLADNKVGEFSMWDFEALDKELSEILDLDTVLKSPVDKILVEFLRVNTFIKKTMPYANFDDWTENTGSYQHLPLERKLELLQPFIDSGKRITICEDHPDHYEYFKKHINANPDDCCDLRL